MKEQIKDLFKTRKRDRITHLFFNSLIFFVILLLIIGGLGIIGILQKDADEDVFKALGFAIAIIWACIFVGYFLWASYFYNINYGCTETDWNEYFNAQKRKSLGLEVDESELKKPADNNPYKDQTFGLPGGTVRGMIAFTLLFGGIAIMVVSMGMDTDLTANTFFWDHYEFFKTAFLMMIAFYFGSRSLEYLRDRWPSTAQKMRLSGQKPSQMSSDDEYETAHAPAEFSATDIKKILAKSEREEPADESETESLVIKTKQQQLSKEFIQINDNERAKILNDEQIETAAKQHGIEIPAIKAVIEVESRGSGFLKNGKPKILFEGHKFWSHLQKKGIDPQQFLPDNSSILYPKWTRDYYLGGAGEYERLNRAKLIDKESAYYSASWGLFQILGENVQTKWVKRHKNIDAFVEAQFESEYEHLLDFFDFIQNKKAKGKSLLEHLKAKDWASFAYGYNGAGYAKNNYDTKLEAAYQKHTAVG
ncbi:MAG: N-acetylmuramidase family protein [Cyclobacteriaceae bacterium]